MTVWTPVEPLLDEPAPKANYWPTFKVGDRVRVRLSGECRVLWTDAPHNTPAEKYQCGHVPQENGRLGAVAKCHDSAVFPCANTVNIAHPYPVEVDEPFMWEGVLWGGGHYAACELEPIDGD